MVYLLNMASKGAPASQTYVFAISLWDSLTNELPLHNALTLNTFLKQLLLQFAQTPQ